MERIFEFPERLKIYKNRARVRYIILASALLISIGSIYYTNLVVNQLKAREQRLIELYASAIEFAVNESSNENLTFLTQEIIVPNNSIPVIWTDAMGNYISSRNVPIDSSRSPTQIKNYIQRQINEMMSEHEPIVLNFVNDAGEIYDYNYVYYKNSFLLKQLNYYPYIQLTVIAIFALFAYLAFSYSKTAEQNRVWIGLAKETAHQLGTPLSSMMAWLEYIKHDDRLKNDSIVEELGKDVHRLEMITARFSNIGSLPSLAEENVVDAIQQTVNYLIPRVSSKMQLEVTTNDPTLTAMINVPLFDWVIENLCKNAVDAMGGVGTITISVLKGNEGRVIIDIQDEGKGIPKSKLNQVFEPGFTTKKRGWGLGLTLVKRIIENYHGGRIFVKSSEPSKGTTFRIILIPAATQKLIEKKEADFVK